MPAASSSYSAGVYSPCPPPHPPAPLGGTRHARRLILLLRGVGTRHARSLILLLRGVGTRLARSLILLLRGGALVHDGHQRRGVMGRIPSTDKSPGQRGALTPRGILQCRGHAAALDTPVNMVASWELDMSSAGGVGACGARRAPPVLCAKLIPRGRGKTRPLSPPLTECPRPGTPAAR